MRPSFTAAIRLRPPSQWLLLATRVAIVVLAACAMAQPLLLTPGRLATWDARVARAVVVDTSASMSAADAQAREAADAEVRAGDALRIEAADLQEGLARAVAALSAEPPARRELVIVSDLHHGSIRADDVARVPAHVGVRFVEVGRPASQRDLSGTRIFGTQSIRPRRQSIELLPRGTRTVLAPAGSEPHGGLRLITRPEDQEAVAGLLRTVALAGAPAPDEREPLVMRFADQESTTPSPIREGWMVHTILRVRDDDALQRTARSAGDASLPDAEPWTAIVRRPDGALLARAAAAGPELLIDVVSPPSTLFAAALLRGVLTARHGSFERSETEILRIDAETLSAWSRAPAPIGEHAWRQARSSDGRWLWAAALVLLVFEQWLRWRMNGRQGREDHRAAA